MPPALRRRPRRSTSSAAKRRRRAQLIASLAAAAIGSLVLAPASFANFYAPEYGGSPNADHIHSLYIIVLVMAIIVFVIVEAALVYSVWKFRAKKGAVAAQIHGNTRLEIGWTVGAAVILLALAVITFIKLPSIINPPNSDADGLQLSASLNKPQPPNGKKLVICVQGRQFIWRYSYSSGGTNNCLNDTWAKQLPYSYTTMEVPANTTVVLDIQSTDVIHSWWVPQLGGKVDAVPGYTTYTWFKAPHPGVSYRGQCAQLCGADHAAMIAYVKVVTPAQYTEWLATQAQAIKAANDQVAQLRALLTANGNYGTT
jgi:cytochrome c oxidase subunit 2